MGRLPAFTCSICDQRFTRRNLLNAHLVAVHAVKPGIPAKDEPVVTTSVHSLAYTPVTQEFYELAAMRGHSLLTVAMDLVEEYVVSNGGDWDDIMTYVQDVLRDRAGKRPIVPPIDNDRIPF
jgi:hypothetical protein